MRKFLFVSRHEFSPKQAELAKAQGVELVQSPDLDAFDPGLEDTLVAACREQGCTGVVAVHPLLAAAALRNDLDFGSFRNINRAPVGEPARFDTDLFQVIFPRV